MSRIEFARGVWGLVGIPMVVAVGVAASGLAVAGSAARSVAVSQKDRMFQPGAVTLERGGAVELVNDDAPLLHHAYVSTPEFSFDSGEQQPDSHTAIHFPVPGTFTVRCAIHPKMRLVVTVQ